MANVIYNGFKKKIMDGSINLATDTIKVMLLTSAYNAADASKQDNHVFLTASAWAASTVYAVGARVRPVVRNGHVYECTTGGTSGATEPTWPTTDGGTVVDGTVTWTCRAGADASYYEVAGTGYTAGGATLANKTVTQDNTNNRGVFDADDVTWAASTITARYAAVYKDTASGLTSPLICLFDFATDQISSSGNFTITWNASGILYIG